jgi:hypothetical protein
LKPLLLHERDIDMNKQLRKAVIAGNWKMNKTPAEAKELVENIKPLVKNAGCDVVVCVPYVDLGVVLEAVKVPRSASAPRTAIGKIPARSRGKFPPLCSPPSACSM